MFGYVRPLRGELKVRDWESYQAAYCGLCHTLSRRCGFAARFTLNYDFVFLALLLDPGDGSKVCPRRCAAHPFRRRPCLEGGPSLGLAAEESVILAHYKLLDTLADDGLWQRLGARLALLLLRRSYRKAAAAQPQFDRHVACCLRELQTLEADKSSDLDRTADTFARLLQGAAPRTEDGGRDRPMEQLLYHLGRWIYLADGVNDLAEDRALGRYNPVSARFGGTPDLEYLSTTMTHSLTLAQSAFQLLSRTRWSDILENILYLGLPRVQTQALAGCWGQNHKGAYADE